MAVHAGNHDHDGNEKINKEQHVCKQNENFERAAHSVYGRFLYTRCQSLRSSFINSDRRDFDFLGNTHCKGLLSYSKLFTIFDPTNFLLRSRKHVDLVRFPAILLRILTHPLHINVVRQRSS